MKISTWNVNSIKARLITVLDWLVQEKPDVVLLQELKCQTEAFPYQEIEDLGYNIAVHGQKTYNGVAIFSKFPLSDIIIDFPGNPVPDEARYIEALVNLSSTAIRVASVYVPNGQRLTSEKYQKKIEFLEQLGRYYQTFQDEKIVVGGDFNVALTDMDVYDHISLHESILFSAKERQQLRKFIATGLTDIYRVSNTDEGFTWWDYRANSFARNNGMRIDYLFATPEMVELNTGCLVFKQWRGKEKASDHVPVTAIFIEN